jgi:hypothetical protein
VGGVAIEGLWPFAIQTDANVNDRAIGSRLGTVASRSILAVFLVIDTSKAAGYTMRALYRANLETPVDLEKSNIENAMMREFSEKH